MLTLNSLHRTAATNSRRPSVCSTSRVGHIKIEPRRHWTWRKAHWMLIFYKKGKRSSTWYSRHGHHKGALCMARNKQRRITYLPYTQCESKKIPPLRFSEIFPKRLGIFNQFFTHLLHYHFYTRLQIFIQISPTLTKLCHTKRDHLANFYISLEL